VPNHGATFYFSIPKAAPQPRAMISQATEDPPS